MSSTDTMFGRILLSQLKPAMIKAGKRLMKDAWVYEFGCNDWEFHGPDNYYWHGNASGAYEARYKGWMAWLESQGIIVEEELNNDS